MTGGKTSKGFDLSNFKAVSILLCCFFSFQAYACITTQELRIGNPNVELQTLFYITQRKESVRMAVTRSPTDGKTIFTIMKCVEPKQFTIEDADEWAPTSCEPISPLWLPLYDASSLDNSVVEEFTDSIGRSLQLYLESFGYDKSTQGILEGFDIVMNGSIGFALEHYARQYTATTWLGRRARWAARSGGWLMMISTMWGGYFEFSNLFKNQDRMDRVVEFTQLVEGLERHVFFRFDGNERSTQVYDSMSVIETAIQDASVAINKKYCARAQEVENGL